MNFLRSAINKIEESLIDKLQKRLLSKPIVYGEKDRLVIGKRVSVANTLFNTRSGRITVGERVIFGHNCMVLTGFHDYKLKDEKLRRPTVEEPIMNINIGAGAWIASGVIILGGVTIGENSVVGAGSVVSKDIPNDVIAVGNPAKPIKPIDYRK